MKLLKIGELAKEVGITVRTLHHYEAIGLLQVTANRESGHRLYNSKDLERLQQIVSLKCMGLSLAEIGKCLDEDAYDLRHTLLLQKESIAKQIADLQTMHQTLRLMLDRLSQEESLTNIELLTLIKQVNTMEKLYTPDQLKKLKDRYEQFPDQVKKVEQAWPILFKKFEDAMNKGLSASDPKVQALAQQAQSYIDLFTGGDKEIEANLDKGYAQNQENALKTWGVQKAVFEYADLARKAWKKDTKT